MRCRWRVTLGDLGLAVRLALDAQPAGARDRDRRRRHAARRTCSPSPRRSPSAGVSSKRAAPPSAARRLAARRGAVPARRAPRSTRRARACAPGELREAGLLYERLVAQGSATRPPPPAWRWGGCSAGSGATKRPPDTCRPPRARPALRTAAWRALCAPLLALGFRGAAGELVARLRKDLPALPRNPEEVVALEEAEAAAAEGDGVLPARRSAGAATAVARRFEIRRMLGGGATGRVYEALDTLLGTPVALKLLQLGGAPGDPERQAYHASRARPRRPGRLRHPNIVALHDAQPASGLFVFELMPGGTLADRLAAHGRAVARRGRAGWRWICWRRWARPTSAASFTATSSPRTSSSTPPATRSSATSAAPTSPTSGRRRSGGFLGTLAYMSPEQISSAPIGAAADLYALGATLFEALTGRPPFLGPDLVGQHLGEAPPPAAALRADARAARTTRRCCARSRRRRPIGSARRSRWPRPWRRGRSRRPRWPPRCPKPSARARRRASAW